MLLFHHIRPTSLKLKGSDWPGQSQDDLLKWKACRSRSQCISSTETFQLLYPQHTNPTRQQRFPGYVSSSSRCHEEHIQLENKISFPASVAGVVNAKWKDTDILFTTHKQLEICVIWTAVRGDCASLSVTNIHSTNNQWSCGLDGYIWQNQNVSVPWVRRVTSRNSSKYSLWVDFPSELVKLTLISFCGFCFLIL